MRLLRLNFYCLLLIVGFSEVAAQNIVINGDFEAYSTCPYYVSQLSFAEGWSPPTEGTPDYFNACLTTAFSMSVPGNQFGNEMAHSGNGYAGFYAFYSNSSFITVPDAYREYVNTRLSEPMLPGATYKVEYYVSLSEASKYGVGDVELLFSVTEPVRTDELAITLEPQVSNSSGEPLINKEGWTKITSCFVADSAYQFLTIGNFNSGENTTAIFLDSETSNLHYSYYYVDDVSVEILEKPEVSSEVNPCDPFSIEVLNPSEDGVYLWNTGESGSSIIVGSSGEYWTSTFTEGCWVNSDTTSVNFHPSNEFTLGVDTVVDFCETENLTIYPDDYYENSIGFLWSTGETSEEITVSSGGEYTLTITDLNGCTSLDEIIIVDSCVGSVYIPNAFTPNADGLNDELVIHATNIRLVSFQVFNRWGELIFESNEIGHAWNALNQPIDLYVWQVEYVLNNASETSVVKRGSVLVSR